MKIPLDLTSKRSPTPSSSPASSVSPSPSPTPASKSGLMVKKIRKRTMLPCEHCGKEFDRPSLLTRHLRTHTGEKPHICDICSKGFSTSSSLNTHRRIHTGDKPHRCPTCNKCFTASSNLYYHRMTHNKEKPHKCHLCSKSFPTPGDLKSHMYVHDGSWPFKCPVCDRGFSKPTNLKNHMYIHTGDKPHKCDICDKHFALACNLRAHIRTHHEGEDNSTISTISNQGTSSGLSPKNHQLNVKLDNSTNGLNEQEQQHSSDSLPSKSNSHKQQRLTTPMSMTPDRIDPLNSAKMSQVALEDGSKGRDNMNDTNDHPFGNDFGALLQQAIASNQLLHNPIPQQEANPLTNQGFNSNLLSSLQAITEQQQFNQETIAAMVAAADLQRQIAAANLHHQNQLVAAAAAAAAAAAVPQQPNPAQNPNMNMTFDLLLRTLLPFCSR